MTSLSVLQALSLTETTDLIIDGLFLIEFWCDSKMVVCGMGGDYTRIAGTWWFMLVRHF